MKLAPPREPDVFRKFEEGWEHVGGHWEIQCPNKLYRDDPDKQWYAIDRRQEAPEGKPFKYLRDAKRWIIDQIRLGL